MDWQASDWEKWFEGTKYELGVLRVFVARNERLASAYLTICYG